MEDAVADRLEACERGFVEITGAAGCGKSTALAHLAEVFAADPRLELADGPDAEMILWLASDTADYRLVVCASPERAPHRRTAEKWRLKPWTSDDWIEYLLAVHGDRCALVMRCVLADLDRLLPGGNRTPVAGDSRPHGGGRSGDRNQGTRRAASCTIAESHSHGRLPAAGASWRLKTRAAPSASTTPAVGGCRSGDTRCSFTPCLNFRWPRNTWPAI